MNEYYNASLALSLLEPYLTRKEFLSLRCVNKLWYQTITAQKLHCCYLRIPTNKINEEEATPFTHSVAIRDITLEFANTKLVHANYSKLLPSFSHRVENLSIIMRCEMKRNVKLVRTVCQIMNKVWFVHLKTITVHNICDISCNKSIHRSYKGSIRKLRRGKETLFSTLSFYFHRLIDFDTLLLSYL